MCPSGNFGEQAASIDEGLILPRNIKMACRLLARAHVNYCITPPPRQVPRCGCSAPGSTPPWSAPRPLQSVAHCTPSRAHPTSLRIRLPLLRDFMHFLQVISNVHWLIAVARFCLHGTETPQYPRLTATPVPMPSSDLLVDDFRSKRSSSVPIH